MPRAPSSFSQIGSGQFGRNAPKDPVTKHSTSPGGRGLCSCGELRPCSCGDFCPVCCGDLKDEDQKVVCTMDDCEWEQPKKEKT